MIHNSRASNLLLKLLEHEFSIPEEQLRRGKRYCVKQPHDHGIDRWTLGSTPLLLQLSHACLAGTVYLGSNHRLRALIKRALSGEGAPLKIGVIGKGGLQMLTMQD